MIGTMPPSLVPGERRPPIFFSVAPAPILKRPASRLPVIVSTPYTSLLTFETRKVACFASSDLSAMF